MPKISDLTAATAINPGDDLVIVQSGTTKKIDAYLVPVYQRTADEITAGVTPSNYQYPPLNVLRYGADPTGTNDSYAAFAAALSIVNTVSGTVYVPRGYYKISQTLSVTKDGVQFRGETNGGTISSNTDILGSHLAYTGTDGEPLISVGKGTGSILYTFKIDGLRLGAVAGLATKPILLRLRQVSEFQLTDISFRSGAAVGLELDGVGGGWVKNFYCGANEVHIKANKVTAGGTFTNNTYVWFSDGNLWDATTAMVQFAGSDASSFTFYSCWFEKAPTMVSLEPTHTDGFNVFSIRFLFCVFTGLSGTSVNGWVIKAVPNQTSGAMRLIDWQIDNCRFVNADTLDAVLYSKGTNGEANSYFERLTISNCTTNATGGAYVNSDTASTSAFFVANHKSSAQSWVAGSARAHLFNKVFGYWDMSGGYPLRLPTLQPNSNTVKGQVRFNESINRIEVTDGTNLKIVPVEAAAQVDSTAADVATLKTDFNSLLAKLRTANVIDT